MNKVSGAWEKSRYVTLVFVAILHGVLIAALLSVLQNRDRPTQQAKPVELVLLAPLHPPTMHIADVGIRRVGAATSLAVVQPQLDSSAILVSAAGSSTQSGSESGIDWSAEAQRALQAFEIRNHTFSGAKSVSARPEEDNWLPSGRDHVGERLKLANGDWIVWIDANCYQVASAGRSSRGADEKIPVCRDKTHRAAE